VTSASSSTTRIFFAMLSVISAMQLNRDTPAERFYLAVSQM
jgi:hypothetical protein